MSYFVLTIIASFFWTPLSAYSSELVSDCFTVQGEDADRELISEVYHQLPPKMKSVLCSENVHFKVVSSLPKKAIGLAIPKMNTIILKKRVMQESSQSVTHELNAKKNIIHELAHIFMSRAGLDKNELIIHSRRTRNSFFFRRDRKRDFNKEASFDSYEFKNIKEFFAVNTEYFLTEETFRCKRPLQYDYLKEIYEHSPFLEVQCDSTKMLPIESKLLKPFQELDFNQLYAVDYLVAGKADPVMSRFGHSMIRLVFCSHHRKVKSEDCYQDIADHYVLSYRAHIHTLKLNVLGGVVGSYKSRMFVYPMQDIIDEYSKTEKRSLISYPLKKNYEISDIKNAIFDQAWVYEGKYKFLSNNCATETLSFFQMFIRSNEVFELRSTTPNVLARGMLKRGLLELDPMINLDEAIRKGRYFAPQDSDLEQVYSLLEESEKSLQEFLSLNVEERASIYKNNQLDLRMVASYLIIQKSIVEKKYEDLVALTVTDAAHENDRAYLAKIKEFKQGFDLITQKIIGIPSSKEFAGIFNKYKTMNLSFIKQRLESRYKNELEKISQEENLVKFLREKLITN